MLISCFFINVYYSIIKYAVYILIFVFQVELALSLTSVMPPKPTVSDSAAFLAILDNTEVVDKLRHILTVSIEFVFDEKIKPVTTKLENIASDLKSLCNRITTLETSNAALVKENADLRSNLNTLNSKVNQLEQVSRCKNLVLNGVSETYAERVSESHEIGGPPPAQREDTLRTTCKVFEETCGVSVKPEDILSAFRLPSKSAGPRPILVSFQNQSTRTAIIKSRRPRQKLEFQGSPVYLNDHLTPTNAEIFKKARQLVKDHTAHSSWTSDGQPMIRWSASDRPVKITSLSELRHP